MATAGFELFDHTADLGIRAWAPERPGLIAPLADGLYAAIGELVAGRPGGQCDLAFDATPAIAVRDLLAELLHAFDAEGRIATAIHVDTFDEAALRVAVTWAAVDPDASILAREVKAITYHELAVRPVDAGWEAVIIVDI